MPGAVVVSTIPPTFITPSLIPTVVTTIITAVITAVITTVAMSFLITRYVLAIIPIVLHKDNALTAGIVFMAMLFPVFPVLPGYAQIDRWAVNRHPRHDKYRSRKDNSWRRKTSEIKPTIESWLTYADGNANVGSECRGGKACS